MYREVVAGAVSPPPETGTICWPLEAWGRLTFITLIFDNFTIEMGVNRYIMGLRCPHVVLAVASNIYTLLTLGLFDIKI